jgi:predicted nucleic acid-binding protein
VSAVVVDTSAWIDFFAGEPIPTLEDGLAHGAIVVPPIVVAELLSGAQRRAERDTLQHLFDDLPLHATPGAHWIRVGNLRRTLRSHGLAVSTPDAHVAQCALDLHGVLVTRDAIFARVARHVPLRIAAG